MAGYGRMNTRFKRAYGGVSVAPESEGFTVLLDGTPAETQGGRGLVVPSRALAQAIAAEWVGAGTMVDLSAMTLTRLAMTALDRSADRRSWERDILAYAGSDLLCYRAAAPPALARQQSELWSPVLDWARNWGADFATTAGVSAIAQPQSALDAVEARLMRLDPWRLLAVKGLAPLLGSALLALACEAGAFAADMIFAAARVDERFQRERWGDDPEAVAREAAIEAEFKALMRWLEVLG